MNIKEFLELSAGNWFAQRTKYYLDKEKAENSKSDIITEILDRDNSELIRLGQENNLDSQTILAAQKVSWNNSVDLGKPKDIGSVIVIFIADRIGIQSGQFLRSDSFQSKLIPGRYDLGKDEALTLILEREKFCFQERIWFASPNLRLRTTLSKQNNGASTTAFYSEIRRVS